MHLSALSPFGPIFAKELRTAARRRRNYLLRVGYLGSLLLFLLFAYGIAREWGPSGIAARAREQEALGWAFFTCFSIFSVSAMALIGPVLTSTAINGERLHKTFHVLLMTPINAWQIAAGKLFSRMLAALVLLGLSLPVLALVRLLGGVEIQDMFGVILLAAATALASASLGLLLSTIMNRTYAVILLSYAALIFLYLLVPLITQLMMVVYAGSRSMPLMMTWLKWMTAMNPIFCVMFKSMDKMRGLSVSWYPCIGVHLGITALLLVLTSMVLRRLARREGEGAKPPPPETMPAPAIVAGYGEILPPLPTAAAPVPARRTRTVGDNPILWREIRRPLMPRLWQRAVAAVCVIGLLLVTYYLFSQSHDLHQTGTHAGYACVMYSLFLLILCVLSGTAIAQEKEGDTWTILLASPIRARSIVWGKTMGILSRLSWWYLLIVAHFVVFAFAGFLSWTAVLITLVVMLSFSSIFIASGLYLSLRLGKVTAAVIVNLLLPILLYGGVSLALVTAENLFEQRNLSDNATWYLPYFYIVEALNSLRPGSTAPMLAMPGSNGSVDAATWYSVVVPVCAAHVLLALLVLTWTTVRFNRIVGRAPEVVERGGVAGI